jgi:hypothetical protein
VKAHSVHLARLVHLRIPLLVRVLGRTRSVENRRIHDGPGTEAHGNSCCPGRTAEGSVEGSIGTAYERPTYRGGPIPIVVIPMRVPPSPVFRLIPVRKPVEVSILLVPAFLPSPVSRILAIIPVVVVLAFTVSVQNEKM